VFILFVVVGCSRSYYRQRADADTYPLLAERVAGPSSAVGRRQHSYRTACRLAAGRPVPAGRHS